MLGAAYCCIGCPTLDHLIVYNPFYRIARRASGSYAVMFCAFYFSPPNAHEMHIADTEYCVQKNG